MGDTSFEKRIKIMSNKDEIQLPSLLQNNLFLFLLGYTERIND
ncbi:MAG: hypothetical protein O7C59_02185 [Rickettsia endosymbiont of Ixodes persulcatus]|nr:hypothetical protein [Rickettsia endosymbiont of Ixodes persulcatus]MCZ6903420.1 hypothetical protein [Rickettsia endosymbiont of Ixodes persulcatus]MCZ6910175.1 hypothetical protein [Rickettsia endosymbiont of Ixodes persulcatus]MCZ6913416.1 hypothetical protein [Rickettsia endosymbiont of Ixodes persulcatus]MCZ6919596.1 hypothetical protein [Rickettsia endosymbiont of Ixodes persulcatus]